MKNYKNIVFIGMRGSGKTTLGKMLATKLNYNFLDTDQEIEENEGKNINELIAEKGWEYFRAKEKQLVSEIRELTYTIISTGGGIILNSENIHNLKQNGIIVYLKTPLEIIKERLKNGLNRPSLTGQDFLTELDKVYQERKEIYEKSADFVYEKNDVELSEKDIEKILKTIKLKK